MRPSFHHVRALALPIVGFSTLLSGLALSSSPASADNFVCTQSIQTLTVPSGPAAAAAAVTLRGASGLDDEYSHAVGGLGAIVQMTMPVAAGDTLTLHVGCEGGYPDGGGTQGTSAGVGGGSTSIFINGTLFGVAGGGGGAGGDDFLGDSGAGGAGGNAGSAGLAGTSLGSDGPGAAGQGGDGGDATGQGGEGGQSGSRSGGNGGAGGLLSGGLGGTPSSSDVQLDGGGGGGGYLGGGGGGGGGAVNNFEGGGGGGGGSSFVNISGGASGSSTDATTLGDGAAAIAYIYPAPVMVAPNPVEFGQVTSVSGNTSDETVTLTDLGSGAELPVTVDQVAISGASPSFSIVTDNCSGQILENEQHCTVQVAYSPAAGSQGDATASLVFPSSSGVGTVAAVLRGTAVLATPAPLGTPGPQGSPGAQGATGIQGLTGATGAAGIGVTGGKGSVGATGPAGQSGPPYKRLSGVTLRSNTLTACVGCLSKGLTLSYKLARAGHLHMRLARQSATGWRAIGSETLSAGAGLHHFAFTGFAGRQLQSGSYRLVVRSQSGKLFSTPVSLGFTILPS